MMKIRVTTTEFRGLTTCCDIGACRRDWMKDGRKYHCPQKQNVNAALSSLCYPRYVQV